MKNLAIIPARCGSKRLPNKNIKLLNGKPLMAHSIEAALKSGCFSEVIVSTDSEEYAEIARKYGASVPFLRSEEMSQDSTNSWDSVREVLSMYKERGKEFDTLMLLQPTSPLRDGNDIKNAYQLMCDNDYPAVVSVVKEEHPLTIYFPKSETGDLSGAAQTEGFKGMEVYRVNGAIYLCTPEHLQKYPIFFTDYTQCFMSVMPASHSIDVDTDLDFALVEFIMQQKRQGKDL